MKTIRTECSTGVQSANKCRQQLTSGELSFEFDGKRNATFMSSVVQRRRQRDKAKEGENL
jgi:hypothetical protein